MFERFTDRARLVVVGAQREARELNQHYIGPEHVLLGLLAEGGGLGVRSLEALGISPQTVRQRVEEAVGRANPAERVPSGHIPFTPQAKKVLELSLREARNLGHNYIGTEHILLGLIATGEGTAAAVLHGVGADLDGVRAQVTRMVAEHQRRRAEEDPVTTENAEPGYRRPDLTLHGDQHVRRYLETDGATGHEWNGASCLILWTTGARTGRQRVNALIYGRDGDSLLLIASMGGAPANPGWYHNLVAHPEAEVQVMGDRFAVRARTATGAERDRLWRIMTASWPNYDVYITRTTRVIPLVVLERI
jgi:deazaflavin-dependent oxidoreductase (nitroreductase family)